MRGRLLPSMRDFYPRPPRGGRRLTCDGSPLSEEISIHALREEGDPPVQYHVIVWSYFYPRPPRGGRLIFVKMGFVK